MKKLIIIVLAISIYPFGCEGQVNGTLPGDGCDTIYIDDPVKDAEIASFQQVIADLNALNDQLTTDNTSLTASIVAKDNIIASKNAEITALNQNITNITADRDAIAAQLQECLDKPADTVYVDKEVEVMPSPTVDTIFVTHSNDDVNNRRFFIHGPMEAPFPKDITFETKEHCMITVEFPVDVDSVRTQAQFKVRRVQDHENARTIYTLIVE